MASRTPSLQTGRNPFRRRPDHAQGPMLEKPRYIRSTALRLGTYLRPEAPALLVTSFLVLLNTALGVAGPYLLGLGIDQIADPPRLVQLTLLALTVYGLHWVSQYGLSYIVAAVMQRVLHSLRRDLFGHLQLLSLRFFDRQPHGQLMSRLTSDIDAINQALSQNLVELASSALSLAAGLAAMFALNRWLALGSLTVLPLMVLSTVGLGARTRKVYRELQAQLATLNGRMEETFSAQRVVQAFGQAASSIEAFEQDNSAVLVTGMHASLVAMLLQPLMSVLQHVEVAVVAGLGGYLVLRGLASIGTIVTFISYVRLLTRPLRQLGNLYNSLQAALAGAERVFEVIDQEPELVDAPQAVSLQDIEGQVVFDGVNFSYLPGLPVLKDVTLSAEAGATVALVGPTGAGKTTMVNLLTRFYDVHDGAIRIDGRDIRSLQKASLRQRLGIVLQDTFLFSASVLENIRYGRLDATDDECIEAATLANADPFIRRLPEGYHTQLSERGSNLSQGQRQLLAIARAVLGSPSILILDEATSSVDTRTELRIQQALLRLMEGRTSFVIAHRLSTIRNADQVLVIHEGRIIERGTHAQLLAQRGFYYNLYMSQFKGTNAS